MCFPPIRTNLLRSTRKQRQFSVFLFRSSGRHVPTSELTRKNKRCSAPTNTVAYCKHVRNCSCRYYRHRSLRGFQGENAKLLEYDLRSSSNKPRPGATTTEYRKGRRGKTEVSLRLLLSFCVGSYFQLSSYLSVYATQGLQTE